VNDDLAARVARLESIEEIAKLKARYCAYCDDRYDPDGIASLFIENAIWDGGVFGRYEGQEAIRAFFARVSSEITFAAHLVLNPIIELQSADSATGKWRLIMPATFIAAGKPEARWHFAAYDDTFVRDAGVWRFATLRVHVNYWGPALESWAESARL
jgi:hypothetical protein